MATKIQSTFSRGEVGPALYGRVDLALYSMALRRAKNMLVHQFGGVSNRPGMKYLGPVKDHAVGARLQKFQFKSTDVHMLEFGNLYIRFMRNDAHITETPVVITGVTAANPAVVTTSGAHGYTNGDEVYITGVVGMGELNNGRYIVGNVATTTMELTNQLTGVALDSSAFTAYSSAGTVAKIYEIVSPYTTAELPLLKFSQTADVMTIVHPDHAPATLSRLALANWSLADIEFSPSIAFPTTVSASGGSAAATYYAVTSHNEDNEESLQGLGNAPAVDNIEGATKANPCVLTLTGHAFLDGDLIQIDNVVGMTELNGRRFTAINVATNTIELRGEDSTNFGTWSSGGTVTPCFVSHTKSTDVTISWVGNDDAVRYSIYKLSAGVFGWIGSSAGLSFLDTGLSADTGLTPPVFTEPFILDDHKPGAVTNHQQRQVLGGSNEKPDTTFFSVVGSLDNFSKRTPAEEGDGFSTTLASNEINVIRHYVSLQSLLIFTSGSEWIAKSSTGDARFSFSTISQTPETYWGCSQIPPIVVGNKAVFISETGRNVRSTGYTFSSDAYTAEELSLMVPHLFRDAVAVDWGHVTSPEPVIYIVMSDGTCNILTYNEEQEVMAWSTADTDGKYESVATVRPSSDDTAEEAFFVVKRTIGGTTRRYIERTVSREFTDVQDAIFLDSSLSLDLPIDITSVTLANPAVVTAAGHGYTDGDKVVINNIEWETTEDEYGNFDQPDQLNTRTYTVQSSLTNTFELVDIDTGVAVNSSAFLAYVEGGKVRKKYSSFSGLQHLAGTAVQVLADGNVIKNLTVSSTGSLTLPRRFGRVHVGLPYTSEIETLDPEITSRSITTIQGKKKKVGKVIVRFERSRGAWIGPTTTDLIEIKTREYENYGQPTSLLTGDEEVVLTSRWNEHGRLVIRQRDPLPMTVLAIVADYI